MRYTGLLLSLPVLGITLWTFVSNDTSHMKPAHLISGHQDITCVSCHQAQASSARQEIQNNLLYVLGKSDVVIPFRHQPVDSGACLNCHERADERHPIYRFREPRFAKTRRELDATNCLTCHSEHTAQRVEIQDISFCKHCHSELVMKNDPLDTPHDVLIKNEDWQTCLGCHDFHGNHLYQTPKNLNAAHSASEILEYFAQGADPYSKMKKSKGKTE